jgi:AhpD family alkylhydroperoxidase
MSERLNYADAAPGAYQAMLGIETYVRGCGLEQSLLELMKVRASQLNRCAYCLDMHCKDARAAGESAQRLDLVAAWREACCYSAHERAALAWTEVLTQLGPRGVPDDVYEDAKSLFTAPELVTVAMVVIAINSWNRLAIAFRSPESGSYVTRDTVRVA